ncbi:MAG TPA: pyridoxamine 5'-phosphate oxidase family protein [Nitrososphaera sp.]|nr:pyridoxamine 5'-phosphate oxidase family protein [Nitrososphaera sp.]
MKLVLADSHAKPLAKREVAQLLARPNILRLAYLDETGHPVVHPVWYYYSRGKFFAATDMNSAKARALRKNSSVYFLVDESPKGGPTRGVRGRGTAKVVDDPAYAARVTRRNVKRYLGSLTSKAAKTVLEMGPDSCVLEITPSYIGTWKF